MFPIRCVVESVRGSDCPTCSEGGDVLVDSYAIVSGHTPLSQLVDTVLMALGCSHLSLDAKGKIQVKSWKPLAFKDITEDIDESIENLLKDVSNHLTLRIVTKATESMAGDTLTELKERLLKTLVNQTPSPISNIQDIQLKNFVEKLVRGEPNLQSAAFDSQILTKFNDWCSQRQVIYPSSMANGQQPVIAAKFHSLLELPKLQRWFRDSPNPSRRKLLSHLHILNSSNYRRHNPKLTYQQICNYFANARAMQRKTVGQDSHNSLAVAADCSPPSVCVSDSSGNVNSIPEVSPHSSTDKPDRQELPTGLDRSPSSNSSCGRHNFDVKVEDRGPDEDQMEMADELATTGGKKPDPEGISNSSRLSFSVEDGHYRARSRLMFDPITELPALKRWFEETPHPSWLQIDHFTEALNAMPYRQTYPAVTSHNVKIWFKNRRAKNKRTGGDT